MTVRELLPQPGGSARWIRGLLVTLCAVLAVLLHHGLSDAPVTTMPASAAHTMPGSPPLPAAHSHTGSPAVGVVAHGSHGAACPSMAMQLCTAFGVHSVQLTAPPKSPDHPAFSAPVAVLTGVDIARSVSRAPPDLSLLSLLRI